MGSFLAHPTLLFFEKQFNKRAREMDMSMKGMIQETSPPSKMGRQLKKLLPNKGLSDKNEAPLIELWNDLPYGVKHKTKKTAVYKRCVRAIKVLTAGALGSNDFPLDAEWMDKFEIRMGAAQRKWPLLSIRAGLVHMNASFKPTNDAWLLALAKHPLDTLLYNPETQKSWFLFFAIHGAVECADGRERREMARFSPAEVKALKHLTDVYTTIKNAGRNLSVVERQDLRHRVRELARLLDMMPHKRMPRFFREMGSVDRFAKDYARYLQDNLINYEKLRVYHMRVEGRIWDDYANDLASFLGRKEADIFETVRERYRDSFVTGTK